jgi:hypothetical protein
MFDSSLSPRLARDVFDISGLHHELDGIDWNSPVLRDTCEDLLYWVRPICFAAAVMLLMIILVGALF